MRRLAALVVSTVVCAGLVAAPASPALADDVRDQQWMIDALHLPEAWKITQGEGVVVGMVDTGVSATHPDLVGSVLPGKDSWSVARDGLTDTTGHGTAMASLIVGHGHGPGGKDGMLGVAPKAKVLSYGAMRPEDNGKYDNAELAKGITWLTDNGVDVILLAYGGGTGGTAEEDAVDRAVKEFGIVVVAGVGNTDTQHKLIGAPASYPSVIAVSGSDRNGDFAAISVEDPKNAICAPAEDVIAAVPGGGYDSSKSATSDASAIAAGALALIKAEWPDITRDDMALQIAHTSDDKGPPGNDNKFGWGIIDPYRALTTEIKPNDPAKTPHRKDDPIYQSVAPAGSAVADVGSKRTDPSPWWILGAVVVVAVGAVVTVVVARARRRPQT